MLTCGGRLAFSSSSLGSSLRSFSFLRCDAVCRLFVRLLLLLVGPPRKEPLVVLVGDKRRLCLMVELLDVRKWRGGLRMYSSCCCSKAFASLDMDL